ncbi:MAG: Ig-like domain-containing protein, partial [Verrucomicrobiales bacterium]
MKTICSSRWLIPLMLCASAALADIQVTVTGPGGSASQSLPDAGGSFGMNLPLTANAVNSITVSAEDASGNRASAELFVTQLSLDRIVVSSLETERLSTEEVEQLVADGVIDLDDPENYNVSSFAIVLTVEGVEVPIDLPIAIPINGDPIGDGEDIPMPNWDDDGGGGRRNPRPPPEIIFFAVESVREPGKPIPPPIPGVLVIEGKIRSLKEMFAVRLMLLNTSGIFTLSDVVAEITFPAGGLTSMLPTDGIISFGDIVPGNDGEVGQAEREFIVRGDLIGLRPVEVKFAGSVTGPGIPEDGAIPFSGSAIGEVDVKGPPTFTVRVNHPPSVTAGEPYDLQVEITNTGQIPARYASLELDVSADGQLADCSLDPITGEPDCEYVREPVVRALGHLDAGETAVEVFSVLPDRTGIITSCMGGADQNIQLKVYVGNLGCVTGSFPETGDETSLPTVNVLPANNSQGISIESPVVAFFSETMNHSSITTGSNGSFRVYTSDNTVVPGTLRFETNLTGRTLAIWQVDDGISNRLQPGTDYTAALDDTITDQDGNGLFLSWLSGFRTTTVGEGDVDAPQLDLDILPPVDPAYVLPGERVVVEAYAVDQGSGVDRVELRMRDLSSTNLLYELIDQKAVFAGDLPPYYFTIDSSTLVPGHQYQLHGTARDGNGNEIQSTIDFLLAASAAPPVVVLPDDPTLPQLQGITLSLTPSVTGGVRRVQYFLNSELAPFKTVTLPPWNGGVSTLELSLSNHTVRAVATDGLDQTGEDTYSFELIENPNAPVVSFASEDGEIHAPGDLILVNPSVSDDVGIKGMVVYLDTPDQLLATTADPIIIDSGLLTTGQHQVVVIATNLLGVSNDPATDPDSVLEF